MVDKLKKTVDNNKVSGANFADLSKAFDCILKTNKGLLSK